MSYQKMRERLLARPAVKASYDMQMELSKLGRLVQRAREGSNLLQKELAALSGVAQGDISRLEGGAGEKGPTFETLLRLVHAQGMELVMEFVPKKASGSSDKASSSRKRAAQAAEIEHAPALREAF
jgi:transcriptional regulator with XRE-family HTH domain